MTEPYYPEQTISKTIYFKDKDDAAVDPDSNTCEIFDPTGVSEANPTLIPIVEGEYELNYNIPADAARGDWVIEVTATIGTYKGIERFRFEVEKRP